VARPQTSGSKLQAPGSRLKKIGFDSGKPHEVPQSGTDRAFGASKWYHLKKDATEGFRMALTTRAITAAVVLALAVGGCATNDGEDTTTSQPQSTTTSIADTTTTSDPATTTTTTEPAPDGSEVPEPTHRIASVEPDDTLAVRRAPGAGEQLYARLAPTYSGVRVTGETMIVDDGGEWWEVELLDPVRLFDLGEPLHGSPIVGWVNSAFLQPYDPAFQDVPACRGSGPVEELTPATNSEPADHVFQIREYELGENCLRLVITFGTEFDDSGIAPRYDMITTDMRPVGNVPPFEIERLQGTTVIRLEGIEQAWARQSINVAYEDVLAFAVRRDAGERPIDVYAPVIGWAQGVATSASTGQLIVDIRRTPDAGQLSNNGIHLVGEPVLADGGTLELIGLARPFEATVNIEVRRAGETVIEDFTMTTDYVDAWGVFRYRTTGLDPTDSYSVAVTQDADQPDRVGVSFEIGGRELENGSTFEQIAVTEGDLALTDSFRGFARGTVPFDDVPLAAEVVLGLNTVASETIPRAQLANADAWFVGPDDFDGLVGPFSALNVLSHPGIEQTNVGPRTHCAGPPLEFGPEWTTGRHLVIEPTGIDSCLQWYAVHLLVSPGGEIEAITLDLWGP
jgi:hypothetical protein